MTALKAASKMAAEILRIDVPALHIDAKNAPSQLLLTSKLLDLDHLLEAELELRHAIWKLHRKKYTKVPRRSNIDKAMSGIEFIRRALDGHVW